MHGVLKQFSGELGPQGGGKVQLGVGGLPQQKVADALLATGANEQVDLGQMPGRQVGGQSGFAQVLAARVVRMGLQIGLGSLNDVPPAAVVGSNVEREGSALRGGGLSLIYEALQGCAKAAAVAQHAQPHTSLLKIGHFGHEHVFEEAHKGIDLGWGAAPVFGAKGKQCQVLDAKSGGDLHDVSNTSGTGSMAHGCGQHALFGPAAVAVHDDGHVRWRAHGLARHGGVVGVGQVHLKLMPVAVA